MPRQESAKSDAFLIFFLHSVVKRDSRKSSLLGESAYQTLKDMARTGKGPIKSHESHSPHAQVS
jgi:hypothetical protein